ncbi:hypothetical protein NP493_53g13006 [Ridgeia piscesae]|uniref:Uncharacterized protein n=1 Tax=Ridgeia piscesae TaxID=27915 RepID=A0AAD9UJ54_RIDPI|nr:hypothetical protein NP493_53g13006 [Ridgeia piscesae]
MPVVTTTTTRTTSMAVHTISFRGLAGGIFITLALACVLYVIGFSTTAWSITGHSYRGLWLSCSCYSQNRVEDWFRAVQAMITIGLIGLLLGMILVCVYMCVHTISKNTTIIALVVICFLSAIFMLIGFVIYGTKADDLSWSFIVTVIASILCLLAGILSILQMRSSGVRM